MNGEVAVVVCMSEWVSGSESFIFLNLFNSLNLKPFLFRQIKALNCQSNVFIWLSNKRLIFHMKMWATIMNSN